MKDLKKLNLKAGVEIHQQLDTRNKLFCDCLARLSQDEPIKREIRKLRAVVGELGKVDIAAAYEAVQGKEFEYLVYEKESCEVELDEEPPHSLNPEAMEIGLKIALMLKCEIPNEIQVMRKTVLDGSNTTGFQRTALVGLNGWMDTSFGKVGITSVMVEEDACQLIKRGEKKVIYGLDRLGIPLVEIGTNPDMSNPEQVREAAEKLGMILRSTGKVKRGLGTIRQDVNVSVPGGARVEIKGVQDLRNIPKMVELEAKRQNSIISGGKKVPREVRRVKADLTTEFMRPMPSAARLYPETDITPIKVEKAYIEQLKTKLPELLNEKEERLKLQYSLHPEIAKQIVKSGRGELFEYLAEFTEPKVLATTLTSTLTQLRREGVDVDTLENEHFREVFELLEKGQIAKEAIPDTLTEFAKHPKEKLKDVAKKIAGKAVHQGDVKRIVQKIITDNPEALKAPRPEKVYMGLVMKELRGKVSGKVIMDILLRELKGKG